MAFCSHCGTNNPDESKYCKNCGTRLPTSSSFPVPPPEKKQPAPPPITPPSARGDSLRATAPSPSAPLGKPTSPAAKPKPAIPSRNGNGTAHESAGTLGLIPTHELIRIANALGIDVDYNTLRFWQKRGLVPKPVRGPVDSGRGTRGYYDPSLIDRLAFIREIQKTFSLGLDAIREELDRIDARNAVSGNGHLPDPFEERLAALRSQREQESKKTLLTVLSKALGLSPEEIETIIVQKKDGKSMRLFSNGNPSEDKGAH
jgi:DNA-binding transcriptional MerR regulator